MSMSTQYREIPAQTRFSDFGNGGFLHFSKCLMYFEKARFQISQEAKLGAALLESYPGKRVDFLVAKVDVSYLHPVPVSFDRGGQDLVTRTWLVEPFVSKLGFIQELVDPKTDTVLIHAEIDVALLLEGEGLVPSLNDACKKCLKDYCEGLI